MKPDCGRRTRSPEASRFAQAHLRCLVVAQAHGDHCGLQLDEWVIAASRGQSPLDHEPRLFQLPKLFVREREVVKQSSLARSVRCSWHERIDGGGPFFLAQRDQPKVE